GSAAIRRRRRRGGRGRFPTIRRRGTRSCAAPSRLRSRCRTAGRRRSTSACATTRIRTRRASCRSGWSPRAWTSPTRSTATTARRRAAASAPANNNRCSTAGTRISIASSRGSLAYFARVCCHERPRAADGDRLPLLGAQPADRGARGADARAVQPGPRQQLQVDPRHRDAHLRGRMGVVPAVAGRVAVGTAAVRPVRRPRGAEGGVAGSRAEDARVRRRPHRRRRRSRHRVPDAERHDRRVADRPDGAARRQPCELSPRSNHHAAASAWRGAGEIDGHDCVFQGRPGGSPVVKKLLLASLIASGALLSAAPADSPTIAAFLAPGYPTAIVSAKTVDRIAWTAYEHGLRNVYAAAAPAFAPVRLTQFTADDGVELSDVAISDDGSVVTFVRGTPPNREGWVADPTSNPAGADRTVWAVRIRADGAAAGSPWKIGEVTTPVLSPDGRSVVFARDGQIYAYRITQPPAAAPQPLIKAWGTNRDPVWSPDGTRIAFVSDRVDHSFVGVYDVRAKSLTFLSPSVDHDTSPAWSPDGARVAFIRRPGTPFGQQAHRGTGSIGNPDGPAYDPLATLRGSGRPGAGRGRGQQEPRGDDTRPGLFDATFAGGYTLSFWVADA